MRFARREQREGGHVRAGRLLEHDSDGGVEGALDRVLRGEQEGVERLQKVRAQRRARGRRQRADDDVRHARREERLPNLACVAPRHDREGQRRLRGEQHRELAGGTEAERAAAVL